MESTVVSDVQEQPKQAQKQERIDLFRWQKWIDADGKMWIITCLFGHDKFNRYGANVELLDVENESTIDVPRSEFEGWVKEGTLTRDQRQLLDLVE